MHPLLAFLPPLSRLSTTSTVLPGIAFQVTVTVTVFLRESASWGPKLGQQLSVELTLWVTLQKQSSMDCEQASPAHQPRVREDYDLWGPPHLDILEEICAYRWIPFSWSAGGDECSQGDPPGQSAGSLSLKPQATRSALPRGVTHICRESWGKALRFTEPLCSLQEDQVSERTWP